MRPCGPLPAVALRQTYVTSVAAQRMANLANMLVAHQQAVMLCLCFQVSAACVNECWLCVVQTHMQMT